MSLKNKFLAQWKSIESDDYFYYSKEYIDALPEADRQALMITGMGQAYGMAFLLRKIESIDMFLSQDSILSLVVGKVRKVLPGFLKFAVLEVGPSMLSGKFMLLVGKRMKVDHDQVVEDTIQESLKLLKKSRSELLVFRDFNEKSEVFDKAGFRKIPLLDEAILNIKWDTFDQYLGAMKSHYRSMIKKDMAKLKDIKIVHVSSFKKHVVEMFSLWEQTRQRADEYRRDENIDHDYFRRLSDLSQSSANLFFKGNKLVGFNVLVGGKDSLYPLWLGADYEIRDRHALIFNIYYETIRLAISQGKKIVYFGDTTYDLKMRIGCELRPQFAYLYSRIPFLSYCLEKSSKYLVPEQQVKQRNIWITESK